MSRLSVVREEYRIKKFVGLIKIVIVNRLHIKPVYVEQNLGIKSAQKICHSFLELAFAKPDTDPPAIHLFKAFFFLLFFLVLDFRADFLFIPGLAE